MGWGGGGLWVEVGWRRGLRMTHSCFSLFIVTHAAVDRLWPWCYCGGGLYAILLLGLFIGYTCNMRTESKVWRVSVAQIHRCSQWIGSQSLSAASQNSHTILSSVSSIHGKQLLWHLCHVFVLQLKKIILCTVQLWLDTWLTSFSRYEPSSHWSSCLSCKMQTWYSSAVSSLSSTKAKLLPVNVDCEIKPKT